MLKTKTTILTDLYFWKWITASSKAVMLPEYSYWKTHLEKKLKDAIFFPKLEVEVYPSYHFWLPIRNFIMNFSGFTGINFSLESGLKLFSESEEEFLKWNLLIVLILFTYFPIVFRDFYIFYPRLNLKIDETELIYFDFWAQIPKVIESLLTELLVRDAPLREVYFNAWVWYGFQQRVVPPVDESLYSTEKLHSLIVDYFLGTGTKPEFLELMTLYLNSRSKIKDECSSSLLKKGKSINDKSLAEEFLGYYIFKGVSNEALRFCVANLDFVTKDPLKSRREAWIKEWEGMSDKRRNNVIGWAKQAVEGQIERNAYYASKTEEEMRLEIIAAHEAASSHNESLEELIERGGAMVVPRSFIENGMESPPPEDS